MMIKTGADPSPASQSSAISNSSRLRILLLAEPCNPTWSSVPLVGYNIVRALANRKDLDITLATHIRNRSALENDPLMGLADIHFIDNDWLASPAYQLSRFLRGGSGSGWTINTAMAYPSYIAFEWQTFRHFSQEINQGEFDLIHRVTPVSPVICSPMVRWTKTPVIIGPINGGLPWPREFDELRRREKEWLLPFRKVSRLLPYFSSMYRHAAAIIYASKHTGMEIPKGKGKRYWVPENGVDPERFPLAERWRPPQGPFQFISVGRFAAGKGFNMILEVLSRSEVLADCRFVLVGDGEERSKLEAIIKEKGLQGRVELPGWLDQPTLAAKLHASQAFVFPSVKEFGGGVVMEAMSAALPSIVSDYGGPGETVTAESGIKLRMANREYLTKSLQEAMEKLVQHPELCAQMGKAAVDRVKTEFLWSAKAEKLVAIYRETLVSAATPS